MGDASKRRPKTVHEGRADFIDYWEKLSPEDQQWLQRFNEQVHQGRRNGILESKEKMREIDGERRAFRRDITTKASRFSISELKSLSVLEAMLQNYIAPATCEKVPEKRRGKKETDSR